MIRFILLVFISTLAFSHPHTFIDVYPSIKEDKLKTINFTWKFDEMTSSMLIMELDSNMDGKIDTRENRNTEQEYFSMYEPYEYYTIMYINGKEHSIKPTNFKASIKDHRICFSFDINFDTKLKNVSFEFGDADFYNAMVVKEEFVDAKNIKTKITGVDKDFYYAYKLEFQ